MPLEELSFEKTLVTFGIIYATDSLLQNMAEIVCLCCLRCFIYKPLYSVGHAELRASIIQNHCITFPRRPLHPQFFLPSLD